MFFTYSKLCVISFFAKKIKFLPPKHTSRCFSNEFSQRYWQEFFDGDSFACQSRFDACAAGWPMLVVSVLFLSPASGGVSFIHGEMIS